MENKLFLKAFKRGLLYIENKKNWINEINVFPVADKDTGDNLVKTIKEALIAVEKEIKDNKMFFKKIAEALFETATGNSGLIFSCFFDGFKKGFEENSYHLKEAFKKGFIYGKKYAYESIYNPKEGTILTVIRKMSEVLSEGEGDIMSLLNKAIEEGEKICKETKELVPELKEANVPDAGAIGFLVFWQGFLDELKDNFYEVVLILKIKKGNKKLIYEKLKEKGDSIVINERDDKLKIHIHTFDPDEIRKVLENFGEVLKRDVNKVFND